MFPIHFFFLFSLKWLLSGVPESLESPQWGRAQGFRGWGILGAGGRGKAGKGQRTEEAGAGGGGSGKGSHPRPPYP